MNGEKTKHNKVACSHGARVGVVPLWAHLGSDASHDGPLLGRGGVRISAPYNFTARLLVAHQVMTES